MSVFALMGLSFSMYYISIVKMLQYKIFKSYRGKFNKSQQRALISFLQHEQK